MVDDATAGAGPGDSDVADAGDTDPGATLRAARERVADLARADGRFQVACVRTGVRPSPVTGARFATHDDAEAAADAARRYRDALRTLDPDLPRHDLAAYEVDDGGVQVACARERTDARRANGLPRSAQTATVAGGGVDEWLRVENCPVVHLRRDADPLDDEAVERQLNAKL